MIHKLYTLVDIDNQKFLLSFDDEVMVSEMQTLMASMDEQGGGRFAPKDIFHYSLRDAEKEEVALAAGLNVTVRNSDGTLVGYLRVITDRSYIHYIVDVMVAPKLQGLRLGSKMVHFAIEQLKKGGFIKILLTAIPGKEAFYERMGFKQTMSPVLALRGEDYVTAK